MNSFINGYAVVIGIANYIHINPLPSTVLNDASDVTKLLKNRQLCGYSATQVKHISDTSATKSEICNALNWLAENTMKEDTAIIFFSGHGGQIEADSSTKSYLLPVDADPANLDSSAISSTELTFLIRQIKAGRLLLLLDCCHAGGIGEAKNLNTFLTFEIKSGLDESFYSALVEGRGRAIIASSESNEPSWVLSEMQNSLFTHYLLKALQGEALTRGDGLIRLFDIFDFVAQKISAHDQSQHPILKAEVQNNFPVALQRGGSSIAQTGRKLTRPSIQVAQGDLIAEEEQVFKNLFSDYERIVIKAEFKQGFSDTRVFLVRPIRLNEVADFLAIVKIGPRTPILQEADAYKHYIHQKVAKVMALETVVVSPNGNLAGLLYPFAGDGVFHAESFGTYCINATDHNNHIEQLLDSLFHSLSENWRDSKTLKEYLIRKSYDLILPVNFVLEQSDNSIGDVPYVIDSEEIVEREYAKDDYIKLVGFQVVELDRKNNIATLDVPKKDDGNRLPDSYRVRIHIGADDQYELNQIIDTPITGRIKHTRQMMLQDLAYRVVGDSIDLTSEVLNFNGQNLLNPCVVVPKLLRQTTDMKMAFIHGDLNLENVLVEFDIQSRNIRLIDFANARQDHVLHDLLRLESEFLVHFLPEKMSRMGITDLSTVYAFLEALHISQNRLDAVEDIKGTLPKGFETPFRTILKIRREVQGLLSHRNQWAEYYHGLAIYLLATLKFKNLDDKPSAPLPKQIAFWGAAIFLALLEKPTLEKNYETVSAAESEIDQAQTKYKARSIIAPEAEIGKLNIENEQRDVSVSPPDQEDTTNAKYEAGEIVAPESKIDELNIRNR